MQKLLVIVCFLLLVNGHAVLKTPRPWNTAASKSNPCGGGTAPTAAAATWTVGTTVNLSWQVIAGDGAGDVNVNINAAGGNTFSGSGTKVGSVGSVSTVSLPFVVPDVTCTGANALCTVQVKSSSNWFSCTSVKIVKAAAATSRAATSAAATSAAATSRAAATSAAATSRAAATSAGAATSRAAATSAATSRPAATSVASSKVDSTAAPPTNPDDGDSTVQNVCEIVTGLTFCTIVNGNNVTVTTGQTPDQIDKIAESTFTETLNNPLVFGSANATGCPEAFKQFMCSTFFTLCGADSACQPNCRDAIDKCGLQDSHKGLFDCKQGSETECLTEAKNQAGNNNNQAVSGATKVVASAVLAALLL